MLLKWGHCITKQSYNSIVSGRNDRAGRKAKCPTCPVEIKESDGIDLNIF